MQKQAINLRKENVQERKYTHSILLGAATNDIYMHKVM